MKYCIVIHKMEDESSLQDEEVETEGVDYFVQRSNLEDDGEEIHDVCSEKEEEKGGVALQDENLLQESRLKSRKLHNPYLIEDESATQDNTFEAHLQHNSPSQTEIKKIENKQDFPKIWDFDLEDSVAEDCKAALELLDLSIQPHLTSEDCEVQRNNLSSVCDLSSVATTVSVLDGDEDSLYGCLSDDKVQEWNGTRNVSDNIAEPKSELMLKSPVELSAKIESIIRPSSTTKAIQETDVVECSPHVDITDTFITVCPLETDICRQKTSSELEASSRPQSSTQVESSLKTLHMEPSSITRPRSHANRSFSFRAQSPITPKSASREQFIPESFSNTNVRRPQSPGVLSNRLRTVSPVSSNNTVRSNSPLELNKYSVTQPLESDPPSMMFGLPLKETTTAVETISTSPTFEQTAETVNSVTLSSSPIESANSSRSLSPVDIMEFLRPLSPMELTNHPLSNSPGGLTSLNKPRSLVEKDNFLSPKFNKNINILRAHSLKEPSSTSRSDSPRSFRPHSPEGTTSVLRPRPFSEHRDTKINVLRPLSQVEITNLTSSCAVPLPSSFTPHPSSTTSKLLSSNSTNSARSQTPVEECSGLYTPIELNNILRKSSNSSFTKQSCTEPHSDNELNGTASSTDQRLHSDAIPEEINVHLSGESRLTDTRNSFCLSEDLRLVSEEDRQIARSSVTVQAQDWLPEEVNPQVTAELRTEYGRPEQLSEETTQHSLAEICATPSRNQHSNGPAPSSREDAERSRGLRRPSWLRASMRRVTHFQLGEPPSTLPPLATPDTVLDILENNRRPNSAPGGGGSRTRRADFPRRYSSYSANVLNSSSSVTNLTQAAEPVAVESPSSEDEDDEEEEEDVSSSSDGTRSPRHQQGQQEQEETEMSVGSPLGEWPHNLSSMLACLGCTLGLFNISRFAILSIHFGANFIVQFLLLTLVLGIPLFTLNTCLGQCLCSGVMDMWHISPIFQGVGIALIISQALIGIYSIVGISWMFIYFRDSFITKQDRYRWAEPYQPYREDIGMNGTSQLEQTVPDYLNGIVLQRQHLTSSESSFGHIKFQVAFNLAVVWMIVFVSLSKGLKSYGKVVYVFSLFPVFGMLVLCTKLLGLTPTNVTHQVFPETVWPEFFLNTKSWVAALTEVFFTWGLLGAAAMQIASHNRHKHLLSRDTSLVIVLTLAVLLLAAFLANTCVALLKSHGFEYVPSSFEHRSSYGFLQRRAELHPRFTSTPVRYMSHTTLITGTRVIVPSFDHRQQSGYQVLRLATELVPATLALLGAEAVSPFWAVLFYFVIILFGIAQQLCIWHCVITGIMAINAASLKSWETTITFFSCAGGFVLGLPMTTELGIFVVYFLDYAVGCAWWIMLLYLLEIIAVFVVRGRPYSGETVVATLFNRAGCLQTWAAPLLIFTWNVILPIALVVMCIVVFKTGQFHDLYDWRTIGYEYWAVWTREVGCMLQILPVVVVPLVCIVQTCRYLSNGPRDILERIQLLYRPSLTRPDVISALNSPANSATSAPPAASNILPTPAAETSVAPIEDPPPKYTPPPSYTTATGARIAKLLRQSFRRSMRRLTHALSDNSNNAQPPPPDYAAVLVEINRTLQERDEQEVSQESSTPTSRTSTLQNRTSTMTAADVASILRSSFRRTAHRNIDADQLVDGVAPIHQNACSTPPAARTETESKPENLSVI